MFKINVGPSFLSKVSYFISIWCFVEFLPVFTIVRKVWIWNPHPTLTMMNRNIIAHITITILSTSINSLPAELSSPSCSPPSTPTDITWTRCPFGLDPNAWYGITDNSYGFVKAVEQCETYSTFEHFLENVFVLWRILKFRYFGRNLF